MADVSLLQWLYICGQVYYLTAQFKRSYTAIKMRCVNQKHKVCLVKVSGTKRLKRKISIMIHFLYAYFKREKLKSFRRKDKENGNELKPAFQRLNLHWLFLRFLEFVL